MDDALMVVANLLVCWIGIYICAWRLWYMNAQKTKIEIRAAYIVWLPTLVASSISWVYGEPPSISQLSLGLAVVAHFSFGYEAWRNGLPSYALKVK